MPRGKGRRPPPRGYITAAQAIEIVGRNRLYKLFENGRIKRYRPEGQTHGYYKESEVMAVKNAEDLFYGASKEGPLTGYDAVFSYATLGDMDGLYKMAVKIFPHTANAEVRRSWMRKEPRGHYLMKRVSDGAIVAYFYLLNLRPDRLSDYLHGKMPSRAITPDDIETFQIGKPAQACVMAGIGSDPDVPQKVRSLYSAMLLRGIRQDMGHMGAEGIIIPRLYAFSETVDGITLCARLGMQQWEQPQGKRCMFYLDMETSNALLIRDYKRGLATWKEKHQLPVEDSPQIPQPTTTEYRPAPARPRRKPDQAAITSTLPPGYRGFRSFAAAHGLPPTTIRKAIDHGHLQAEEDGWKVGGATIQYAFNLEQQRECIRQYHTNAGFHPCTILDCPCHEE